MQDTQRGASGTDALTVACVLAYCLLGFVTNGLGAVLPQLRDDLHGLAAVYPTLPGAWLVLIGVLTLRHRHQRHVPHRLIVQRAGVGLAAALGLLVVTAVPVVSAIGAVLMALAAAFLIRLLPAALTSRHPHDSTQVLTMANAWSSLASILGPLAVGAATATGLGWRTGFVAGPAIAAVLVLVMTMVDRDPGPDDDRRVEPAADPTGPRPADGPWVDAWLLLTLSVLIEFAFAVYAATYLRDEVHMGKAAAAAGAAAFAIGMTSGRFLAGSVHWLADRTVHHLLVVVTAGFVLMWCIPKPLPAIGGFAVAGFGSSLLYPKNLDRLMRRFPSSPDRGGSRAGLGSGVALVAAPTIVGAVRAVANVRVAYLTVPVLLVATFATYQWTLRHAPAVTGPVAPH